VEVYALATSGQGCCTDGVFALYKLHSRRNTITENSATLSSAPFNNAVQNGDPRGIRR
jgi:hypothetical protein